MKKSQLRNIIRESIKELMNEQANNVYTYSGYSTGGSYSSDQQWTLGGSPQAFYQAVGSPQPGEFIGVEHSFTGGYWGNGTYVCIRFNGMGTSAGNWGNIASENYNLDLSTANLYPESPSPNGAAACYAGATTPPPTTGCQPTNAFPGSFNLQNWTNTWTSLPNFSSSNPNQPCNFVCQRRNQWTSQLAAGGMGPKQTNQVACKLAEAENQYQIHNCATSNTNNCP